MFQRQLAAALLAGAALALTVTPAAGQKEGGADPIKEISLKDLKLPEAPPGGSVKTPAKIASAEDLAKAFPDKDTRDAIAKQVDFGKQYLLFFRWSGSGGDKILPTVMLSSSGNTVNFLFKGGVTDDLRHHARLFAVHKDLSWKVSP